MNQAELKTYWDGVIGGLRKKRASNEYYYDALHNHKRPEDFCELNYRYDDGYYKYYLYLKGLIAEIEANK